MEAARLAQWPLRGSSRFVRSRPHDWHVQQMGSGQDLLLIHGTGASTHSWREILPLLAQDFRVSAIDLPGHGFTRLGSRMRSSLETISEDIAALCKLEGIAPVAIVGHSAGTAIALRLASKLLPPPRVIGLNPALQPFQGLAGVMFPLAARMMAMTPGMVDILARNMRQPGRISMLLSGTGSALSPAGKGLYEALFTDRDHIDGTLLMMAQWKLDGLIADLPKLQTECLFLTGSQDRMVPPVSAVEAAARMPRASVQSVDGYGHLFHEEAPEKVAQLIRDWLRN